MGQLKMNCIRVGMLSTNCYFLFDDEKKELIIVDPGDNADFISKCADDMGLKPVAIFLTHAHGDHILGVPELKSKYKIPVYIHKDEQKTLYDQRNSMFYAEVNLDDKDVLLEDGQHLEVGGLNIEVIHTPGHTPGGVCYYIKDANVLMAGDTMFFHSWGRTDFPGGDDRALMDSIWNKLLPLPAVTEVYPGHDRATNIATERLTHRYK